MPPVTSGVGRYAARSCLAAAGIAVSVAAMIVLANLVATIHHAASAGLAALGSHVLLVTPSAQARLAPYAVRTIGAADVEVVRNRVRDVDLVMPLYAVQGLVRTERARRVVTIYGVVPGLEAVQGLAVDDGRFIVDAEVAGAMPVVVLGRRVSAALNDPVPGDVIGVSGRPFTVIGIASAGNRLMGVDREDGVFIPASTAQTMYRHVTGSLAFMVQVNPQRAVAEVAGEVRRVLRASRQLAPDQDDDFAIESQGQVLQRMETAAAGAQTLLLSIVGITLIIAVIGVLNSVLTSVLERTTEIGVRRAVGATRGAIQRQFVGEALLIALAGAAAGALAGLALCAGIARVLQLDMVVEWRVTFLALISALVFSGMASLWPAYRAGRLDPVKAVHHE